MSTQQPKSFFTNLRGVLKNIDHDINQIKKNMLEPGRQELACKKICLVQDEIKNLKEQAHGLKKQLEPKITHTDNFIQHFKDLVSETEDLVLNRETYLKQYGYKPIEKPSVVDTMQEEKIKYSSPVKDSSGKENVSTTPNLLQYGLVSRIPKDLDSNIRKSSVENLIPPQKIEMSEAYLNFEKTKESTPTLQIEVLEKNEKESPTKSNIAYVYAYSSPPTPTLQL